MVKHQRVVITSLPISKAIELSLLYFKNLGFFEIQQMPNQYIKFQRGSDLTGHNWQTKKVYLTLQFSLTQDNKVTITCTYDISTFLYVGEKDLESADREIFGFRDYLAQVENRENKKPRRICPKCKREIPWDAKICPYCGYDFTEVKKEETATTQEETKKNVKRCPNCGKEVPIDAVFCPYCGYDFNKDYSDRSLSKLNNVQMAKPMKSPNTTTNMDEKSLSKKYAKLSVIAGVLSILFASITGIIFAIFAIYYGYKATKLNPEKVYGGIILGIIGIILSVVVIFFAVVYSLWSLVFI